MLGIPAGDHLWWQSPIRPSTLATVYGPIFGPFPTAQLAHPRFGASRFSEVCGLQGWEVLPRELMQVQQQMKQPSRGAPSLGDSTTTPPSSADGNDSPAPAERRPSELTGATPSTEDTSRVEICIGGDAHYQWRDGIDEEFPPVDVELIRAVWKRYIVNDGDSACGGTTLMCHDLLNKFTVEPDLLQLFEKVGLLDDVVYVYLPLTYLKSGQTYKLKRSSRNKGYGFVHFSSEDAATKFAQLIRQVDLVGTGRGVKQMYTTLAKFQGVGANLVELLDLKNVQWRPKQGCFYVRLESGGPLNCLGISPMRSFVLEAEAQNTCEE